MFFDSFAWIEYFAGTAVGEKARKLLDDAPVIHTAPIVLAEVYSKLARTFGEASAEAAVRSILDRSAVTPADEGIALAAGAIHAAEKEKDATFGMADAFVLASARARGVPVVTGDPHFRAFPDTILLGTASARNG